MIGESIVGSLVGGVFRLVPEVLKSFDRKNERGHELKMLEAEMNFAKLRGEQEMHKIDASMTIEELNSVAEAINEQGQTARAAGKFVAAISALVRPVVTYWFVFLYSATKIASMIIAVNNGGAWNEVLVAHWTVDDMSMLTMILTFWFVGRVYERQRHSN